MKFYLLIILFTCFVLFAIFIYNFYLFRKKLFNDLIYLCTYLRNSISFKKENINVLIEQSMGNMSFSSRYLIDNRSNSIFKFFIKKEESIISNFFESLGKGDVSFELSNIAYYEEIFKNNYVLSSEELKSKGTMWLKLILGLGLIVCIILI